MSLYLEDVFTVSANLAGIPAVSVPAGFVDGLPVGLQLIGPRGSETRALQIAFAGANAWPAAWLAGDLAAVAGALAGQFRAPERD